jgi:hypothetical protein
MVKGTSFAVRMLTVQISARRLDISSGGRIHGFLQNLY